MRKEITQNSAISCARRQRAAIYFLDLNDYGFWLQNETFWLPFFSTDRKEFKEAARIYEVNLLRIEPPEGARKQSANYEFKTSPRAP